MNEWCCILILLCSLLLTSKIKSIASMFLLFVLCSCNCKNSNWRECAIVIIKHLVFTKSKTIIVSGRRQHHRWQNEKKNMYNGHNAHLIASNTTVVKYNVIALHSIQTEERERKNYERKKRTTVMFKCSWNFLDCLWHMFRMA